MKRSICWLAVVLLAGCSGKEQPPAGAVASLPQVEVQRGRYEADTVAAADTEARVAVLELGGGDRATLTTRSAGQPDVALQGTWATDGPNLAVVFPGRDGADPLTFRWRLISRRLVPVDWDRTQYGPAGLTLHLR